MEGRTQSNWRASPAFNKIFDSLPACVQFIAAEFGHRQRTPFVILRHRINSTWGIMPWAQYRHLPNDHPANPCTICFFGTFGEFRDICLAFPPDLFSGLPAADDPDADPDVPPFTNPTAELHDPDLSDKSDDATDAALKTADQENEVLSDDDREPPLGTTEP